MSISAILILVCLALIVGTLVGFIIGSDRGK